MTLIKFTYPCCGYFDNVLPSYNMIIDLPLSFSKTFLKIWFKKYAMSSLENCPHCGTTIIQYEEYKDTNDIIETLKWKKEIKINDTCITLIPVPFIKYITEKIKEDLDNKKYNYTKYYY